MKQETAAPKRKPAPAPKRRRTAAPEMNAEFREALRLMEETERNLFITGKAGTGKSTLLSYFCRTTKKQPVVLAPTGVAALNVKGQTIHSFFNFYVDVTPEKILRKKAKPRNAKLFKKLQTIVIDEISMVRADLLDCVDTFLRLHGPDADRPFGGVQMIFVGDLYQLPPVVSREEKELFATHYQSPYFFSAHVMEALRAEGVFEHIELEKVYRQKDKNFIALLNKIRNDTADADDIAHLNSRLLKASAPAADEAAITLTTTNTVADALNETRLTGLKGKLHRSTARVTGDFGKEYFPTAPELCFKTGAQVMLLNNDSARRWVNGSIGAIADVKEDDEGQKYLEVRLQDRAAPVQIYPHTWEVYRFGLEGAQLISEPAGSFTQYPFRLAWAITIHKSQGKTFDRVVIDTGKGAFAAGQIYVALSRCTSFSGLALKTPLRAADIRTDRRISAFLTGYHHRLAAQNMPVAEKIAFIRKAIRDEAALNITYLKADDTKTTRQVIPLQVGSARYQGKEYDGMKALCTLRQEERMFRVDRILKIKRA